MFVIFGANGRTGIEIVKEAIRRKMKFRAVARNDHDTHRLRRSYQLMISILQMPII